MSYKKLSEERKSAIGQNANEYAKEKYKQFTLRLAPEVAEKFDTICKQENLSRPAVLQMLIDNYSRD